MKVSSLLLSFAVVFSLILGSIPSIQSSDVQKGAMGFPAGWSDDIRLTFNTTGADDGPSIAVYQNAVHIVHRNIWSGQNEIYYLNSTDGGTTWNQRTRLSPGDPVDSTNPDIGINKSQIHVVWNENDGTGREIVYRNSTDGGITWNNPKIISEDDGFNSEGPKIAVSEDGMKIHVIWVDSRHGAESSPPNTEIYYNRSLDGGITWEGEQRLTNAPFASAPSGIAVNGSNIHITFVDDRTGTFGLYYIRSIDNGVTWDDGQGNVGAAQLISTNEVIDGAIAVNGSALHVVWMSQEPGPVYRLYYRNSTDNGFSWSSAKLLLSSDTINSPDIDVAGDDVQIVFGDWRDGNVEVYYINSTDGGISWNSEIRLTELDGFSSGGPKIALSGSQRHIIWVDQRDGNPEIYYKRFPETLPDTSPPDINHTPVPSANISQTINITANITDDVGVDAVYLNYTGVNGTNYNVSMSQWNGNWSYDIPAQDNIGIVDYFIWCNDTSGNDNQTIVYQIQINDITRPEINHFPVASANVFDVINITANITDDIAVNLVFLNYTGVNGTNYNVSMSKWDGNYSYDIPGQDNIGTLDYFIWANDTSGNDNMTLTFQIQINDITKPEINHVPVVSRNIGQLINITANITDDIAVNLVFLNYTGVNGTNYNISMNKWNGNYSFDIPGQSDTGFVTYFIWANDTSDNDNWTITYQVLIFDITDPEINHIPITSANVSEAINITANVTDDVSVNSVYLNYTGVNGTNYNVSMQKWNGNYSYEIPGQDTIGNVQYFIWANDSDGNDNRTIEYSIQINDVVKPEINHVPVVSANIGETINITVNVTDDVEVDKVFLNYTDVGGDNYNVSMNKYNDNWSYEITGQNDIGVVEYFIWANDTSGNGNQTIVYQVQINDVVKPEFGLFWMSNLDDNTLNVSIEVTDDVAVDSVYMNYTDLQGINHNVSMTQWGSNWSYAMPWPYQVVGEIECFFWTNDTSGNENISFPCSIVMTDIYSPSVVSNSPTGINVSISTVLTITFDESMNTTSVQNAITISPAITISGYSWNADNTILTISLSGNLSYNTTYNVTVGIGAEDITGNALENPYSWEFTTEIQPITNGPNGDDGIGEYWWIIIIIVIVIIIVIYLYWRMQKEEEPEEIEEEKSE